MKTVYLAVNGKTGAAGTKRDPLSTPMEALARARETGAKEIRIAAGVYEMREALRLTKEDRGLRITGDGAVVLSGGKTLDASCLSGVKDRTAKKRLPAPEKTLSADLSGLGLSGTAFEDTVGAPRFFADGKAYEPARFPDNERLPGRSGPYLYSSKIVARKDKNECDLFFEGDEIREHMKRWGKAAYEEMRIRGFLWNQWSYCNYGGVSGDAETGVLTASGYSPYTQDGESTGTRRRTYVSGIAEELDRMGEYWFDKKKEILYFIPCADMPGEISVSVSENPALILENTENITVTGIAFRYFRKTPVIASKSHDILFETCEFSHSSDAACVFDGCRDAVVRNCRAYDLSAGAFWFKNCGTRQTLSRSGCAVENCEISEYGVIDPCYRPAVDALNCCGITVRGCLIRDVPHSALMFWKTNEVLIENNEIRNVCRDCDDCGAIYWGRDPSEIGYTIRGNYFRDIGNDEADFNVDAIYVDDWAVGPEIYNNVFYNAGILTREKMTVHTNANAINLNNAQFLNVHNNIFVDAYQDQKPVNLYPCPSVAQWMMYVNEAYPNGGSPSDTSWYDMLTDAGFFSDAWREYYKNTVWAGMYDLVNEKTRQHVIDAHAADPDDPDKVTVDLAWEALDLTWDHTTEEGNPYPGTFREYIFSAYAKDCEGAENENPLTLLHVGNVVFWKVIWHKLRVRSTNVFRCNVTIGMDRTYLDENENFVGGAMNGFKDNFNPETDRLPDGTSFFVKPGEDFTLTDAGLRYIRSHLPEFHSFRFGK